MHELVGIANGHSPPSKTQEHWTMQALREYTQQPTAYLKEILTEVCDYNKKVRFPLVSPLGCALERDRASTWSCRVRTGAHSS